MKRLHVNLSVVDLDASVSFYTALFAAEPTVRKADYAKWMLEDPRVNFAISTRAGIGGGEHRGGIDHLGIQVEDEDELAEVYARLQAAGGPTLDEGETICCYARSSKQWIADPQGVAWETFLTHGDSPVYGHERGGAGVAREAAAVRADQGIVAATASAAEAPCCGPTAASKPATRTGRGCCG